MMTQFKTIYKCGRCGATNYQPVIGRDASGALKPTGVYRCTGCKMTFTELRAWWGHEGAANHAVALPTVEMSSAALG